LNVVSGPPFLDRSRGGRYTACDVRERDHQTDHSPLDIARGDPEPVEGSKAGSGYRNQSRRCVRARRL